MTPEERLSQLGLELPPTPRPVAAYVPAVRTGHLIFVSGQGPIVAGEQRFKGKVGAELTEAQGYEAARVAILNSLAILKSELGSLSKVRRIVKLTGWVNSAPGFERQPFVMNGASELLEKVFGEQGRHARTAVAANELPMGIPVEVELIAEIAE